MPGRVLAVLAIAAACSLWLPTYAGAQSATATIPVTGVDETGAGLGDAAMSVVNVATGLERTTATGAEGTCTVPFLPPGGYRVTARHDGFTPAEIPELVLNVGDLRDVRLLLKVARLGESLTVTAEPPRISTSPAVGTVV